MPAAFDRAVRAGGKVRTITLPGGRYIHVVLDARTGHWIRGDVKTKKGKS